MINSRNCMTAGLKFKFTIRMIIITFTNFKPLRLRKICVNALIIHWVTGNIVWIRNLNVFNRNLFAFPVVLNIEIPFRRAEMNCLVS